MKIIWIILVLIFIPLFSLSIYLEREERIAKMMCEREQGYYKEVK